MAVDGGDHLVAQVPALGQRGPAPGRELLVPQRAGGLAQQRPVAGQHHGHVQRRQPFSGRGDPGVAPRGAGRVRVGVQPAFVGAEHPGRPRQADRLAGRRRAVGPPRVVVEQEQRRDRDRAVRAVRAVRARPDREGILRREHAEPAAHRHQALVPRRAAQLDRVGARRPQLVVARRPDNPFEPVGERGERPAHIGEHLANVAGHDQPVTRIPRPEPVDEGAVVRIPDVQVADREQPARHYRPAITGPP